MNEWTLPFACHNLQHQIVSVYDKGKGRYHSVLLFYGTLFKPTSMKIWSRVCVCVCKDREIKSKKNYTKVKKWSRYRLDVAQRLGTGIALLFHDRGTRRRWVVSSAPRPHFTHGKEPVPIVQEAGWVPGAGWKGGKSRSHRYSIPDRPGRRQSLYQLSYPAHLTKIKNGKSASIKYNTCTYSKKEVWCIWAKSFTTASLSAGTFNQ